MKSPTKRGLTLVECITALGLSGGLMAGTLALYGTYVEANHPKAIEFNQNTYEVAPSLSATVQAFAFHQAFAEALESAEISLCLPPIKEDFNFASLVHSRPMSEGRVKNIQALLSALGGLQTFRDVHASSTDFTCVLLNRDMGRSTVAQLRTYPVQFNKTPYHIYSVNLYTLNKVKKASYSYAVKASEDAYSQIDPVKRIFEGDPASDIHSPEAFDIVVFPDPYLASGEGFEGHNSLSRFSYLLHAF